MLDVPAHSRRRPQPVADAPAGPLAGGATLAKEWLVRLIEDAPLERAAAIPVSALAAHAPGLCAAVVAALSSDAELERLRPGGDLAGLAARAGALAGARESPDTSVAVEALRAVVWEALRDSWRRPSAALVADLSDRLAHVCAVVAQAALGAPPAGAADQGEDDDPGFGRPDIARALARHEVGAPLALLAVDVDDADRLLAADGRGEVAAALERAEQALAAVLGSGDHLLRRAPGRYWIVAPGSGGSTGHDLAQRLSGAVAGSAAHHGVPLRASVGVATRPQDGCDAETLAACAEERAFGVRASGLQPV
jgi:GGDEF domain-containing protein